MTLTDTSPMPFGKYSGQAMANIPADYLLWLYKKNQQTRTYGKMKAVMDYIEANKEVLEQEVKQGR